MRSPIIICLFLLCHFPILLSQESDEGLMPLREFYNVEKLTVEDGVSSVSAVCFLKDRRGFMWIGTNRGLNRYDGYSFISYVHDEFDKNSLYADFITCLIEDRDGMIWIGTLNGGLNKFNPELEIFTHIPVGKGDPYELGRAMISALCEDGAGNIWFAVQENKQFESVYKINKQSGKIEYVVSDTIHPELPAAIHSHALLLDSEDNMWIGTKEGFARYDSSNRRLVKYELEIYRNSGFSREGTALYEDSQGIIWVGSYGGGLYRFDRKTNKISRHDQVPYNPSFPRSNQIAAIDEDKSGNLVIRTRFGLLYLHRQTNRLIRWEERAEYGANIDFLIYQGMYFDPSGQLWFSISPANSLQAGIYRLDLKNNHFNHISPQLLIFDSQELHWISSIFQANTGNIWVGGTGLGLTEIITSQSPFQLLHYPTALGDGNSFSPDIISAIYQDRSGAMWIGNWKEGVLNRLELSDGRRHFSRFYPKNQIRASRPYKPEDEFIILKDLNSSGAGSMRIYEDNAGNFWIGRGTGLFLFDRATGDFYPFILDPLQHEYYNLPIITSIKEDDSACLWISTMHQGLFKIFPPFRVDPSGVVSGTKTVSFRYDPDMPKDFGHLMLTSLCIPEKNRDIEIWIGTMGGGLIGLKRFNAAKGEETERIVRYSKSDGLSDNTIFGILEDGRGKLWLSTENGLSRFDPESGEFNTYNKTDGLPVQQFHWLSSHKGSDGTMFFGGNNGLLAFHPDSIADNPVVPPVVITNFKLFNRPVPIGNNSPLKKSITETTELKLSYRENYLTFEFAALNYISTESNSYRYMMEGIDEDWIDAGTQRTANYTSLKHGKYTFRVLGSNNDGVWNEEGASLGIVISPPPWLTWWAYVFYGFLTVIIILLYRRYLVNRAKLQTAVEIERMEKEKVEELDHLKSRFFANISHEFRTPLTLLLGPIEDKLKSKENLDQKELRKFKIMQRSAKRLQRLINQLLDLSKLESGTAKLKVSEGDIAEFCRSIAQSFLSLAESRNVNYRIEIPEYPVKAHFDPDVVEKILTNLISNAFKFTPENGSVAISMHVGPGESGNAPTSIKFNVKDTGKGIPGAQAERIFERFYQVNSGDSRESEGTGIGLALCRELAEMHRGKISVKSAIGNGANFRVILPCTRDQFSEDEIVSGKIINPVLDYFLQEEDNMDGRKSIQEGVSSDLEVPVLLIVEDNADLRHYIASNLEDHYQIHEAKNGIEGLKKTIEVIPDLVITDLMMPEMDGKEMCNKVKNDERTSHIPVIMVTAKADRESKIEGLETGADDYLVKPFDSDELKIRVRNMIEQQHRLREKYYKEFVFGDGSMELKSADETFLKQTIDHIQAHISDPGFNVEHLARNMEISHMQLYRKLKGATNMSPGELIRNIRLKSSLVLLKQGSDNISQIAYQVGFSDHSYFSKCFRDLYGKTPKEYAEGMLDIL